MSFKFKLGRIIKSVVTLNLIPAEETRRARCEAYAKKHKTCGKKTVFAVPTGMELV